MAVAPWMLAGVQNTDQSARLALGAGFAHGASSIGVRSGIVFSGSGTDLKITAQGTPNKTFNIAPGQAVIQGTVSASEGPYVHTEDVARVGGTIADGYASNARIDLVAIRVVPTVGQTLGTSTVVIIKGADTTGSPVPAAPLDGSTYFVLARIAVPSLATRATTTIQPGDITMVAPFTSGLGGVLPLKSTDARPADPHPGMVIEETDTGRTFKWNAIQLAWKRMITEDETGLGRVAFSTAAAAQIAAATTADAGPMVTVTFKAGRRYVLKFFGNFTIGAGATHMTLYITDSANAILGTLAARLPVSAGGTNFCAIEDYYEPGAADVTLTLKGRLNCTGGTVTPLYPRLAVIDDGKA